MFLDEESQSLAMLSDFIGKPVSLQVESAYNQERFRQNYHKRSNVESTLHMIKSKFGNTLRSKTRTAQINEALCKILCHNICCLIQSMYELNLKPKFWAEAA